MKLMNIARKYGAKVAAGAASVLAVAAHATGPIDDLFAAVDLSTVVAAVGVVGLAVIGITMAFKAIDLAKRGVRKV
jgi:hypothetical protein